MSIADDPNPRIIDHANPDHTGSPKIIIAPMIAVHEVRKIGFNLVAPALMSACCKDNP